MSLKIQHSKFVLLFLAALFATACESIAIGPGKDDPNPQEPIEKHEAKVLSLSSKQVDINKQQNEYSLNLLRQVAQDGETNLMISPLSADMVLAMLMNGAEGDTKDQVVKALGMSGFTEKEINEYHDKIITALPYLDTQTKVTFANALWVDKGFAPEKDFCETNKKYYHATVDEIELSDKSAADVINTWADEHTNHLIKKVMDPSHCTDELRMVIANALYFKGYWNNPFKKESTREETFTLATGEEKQTQIMNQQDKFLVARYGEGETIDLPANMLRAYYKERAYCMDILLPVDGVSVYELAEQLNADNLATRESQMSTHEVILKLPKWKSEYSRTLNDDMQALGIRNIFSPSAADLSRLSTKEDLFLSILKQFTYISVDEEGTEAAAVTIGEVGCTSVADPIIPIEFYATKPFIYLIRDVKYGTILFAGIYGDPQ